MGPPNESSPRFSAARDVALDHEFEWLLCLASTLKSCQHQPPIAFEASQKPLQSDGTYAPGKTAPVSAWRFALEKIQKWRRPGPNRVA
jgi:hypothetical protein